MSCRKLDCLLLSLGLCAMSLTGTQVFAQPVYTTTPQWQSADMQVSTGAALVDLNRDGWLDLVISNGNDISLQRVVVYYNNGSGTLQATPGWQSATTAYHGHLDVADVNGDGWPDVAVAILLAQGGTIDPRALDRFEPSPEQARVLQQDRETFVAHLFEVLDGRAKSTSGAGHPLVPPAPAP